MAHHLSLNPLAPGQTPFFLWSEDMSRDEFSSILRGDKGDYLKHLYMGRLLREGRISDVWTFLTVADILQHWQAIRPHLGNRRAFWDYLLQVWSAHGLI
jgi:hypothetical protein